MAVGALGAVGAVYPGRTCRLSNGAFITLTAGYFGADIPDCVAARHMRVPGARGAEAHVGRRGEVLMSATFDGGSWTQQHDAGKRCAWQDMRDHGMPADMEVRGMFGAAMDELRRAAGDERRGPECCLRPEWDIDEGGGEYSATRTINA